MSVDPFASSTFNYFNEILPQIASEYASLDSELNEILNTNKMNMLELFKSVAIS